MALITIPKTLPVASDVPQATFNIGRFASVRHWWTTNREAISGLTLNPRKGSVALSASAEPVFETAFGFDFVAGDGNIASPNLSGRVPAPAGSCFTIVSIQRGQVSSGEPWGFAFGDLINRGLRVRPVPIGSAGGLHGYQINGTGGFAHFVTYPGSSNASLDTAFIYMFVFDYRNLGAITLKASVDGQNFFEQTEIPSSPQDAGDSILLTALRSEDQSPWAGPLMDLMLVEGDITEQTDLMAALNRYANDCYINYGG